MERAFTFLEEKILPPLAKLSELPHLRATRDGLVSLLPLILVGSIFLMIGSVFDTNTPQTVRELPVIKSIYNWIISHNLIFLIPYKLTLGLLSLYASFSIAYFLAKTHQTDAIGTSLLSSTAFILTVIPQKVPLTEGGRAEWILPLGKLGGEGLFMAILTAFFTAEVWRWCSKHNLELSMPKGVPPAVTKAFSAIIPAALVIILVWIFRHLLNIDLHSGIVIIFKPLEILGDSLIGVLLINLILHLIWVVGIHGVSVMNAVFLALWLKFLALNEAAYSSGLPLPHITAQPFYQWFVWIGGSGCTLSLVFLLLLSKSPHLKKIGKISLLPGICNINEPLIFGLPITMNPIMAIPFILAPMAAGAIAYTAMWEGWVHRPYLLVTWTLPSPIGGWLSTLDPKAILLFTIIFFVSAIIYFPFVKYYEKKLLLQESNNKSKTPLKEGEKNYE